jgi:hypothetical protein
MSIMKKWRKQEKDVAKKLFGRTTPGSGNSRNIYKKSDVSSKHYRVECKLTEKASVSLKLDVLQKIEKEALYNNQMPVVCADIQGERYAVIRWDDFVAMAHDADQLL